MNKTITLLTEHYNQWLCITDKIEAIVTESGVENGYITVMTLHTTTGIAVNEALECLESDLNVFLGHLAPEDGAYSHARMLRHYGSTAGNPTGHIKAHLTGNHCHFVVRGGKLLKGGAQDVYFCEFDGPAKRTIIVEIQNYI